MHTHFWPDLGLALGAMLIMGAWPAVPKLMKRDVIETALLVAALLFVLFLLPAQAQGYVCRDYWHCRGQYWNDNNFPRYYPQVRVYPRYPYYTGRGAMWGHPGWSRRWGGWW